MQLTEILTDLPVGPYVLAANGELGVYDAQGCLCIDAALSQEFAEHIQGFLRDYLRDPQAEDRRLAILYNAPEPHPWGRLTFSLEDFLVRELYPAGGRASGNLTAFQRKNRVKSLFRGMELMLDYRHDSAPTVPVYCPVLFNSHATLAARATALGRKPRVDERDVPVIDVLNLVATLPHARRTAPALQALMDSLRQALIRKEMRREPQFALLGSEERRITPAPAEDTFAELARDLRLQSDVNLSDVDARRLHETECIDSIERWLSIPHRPVNSGRLRRFVQFHSLDETSLAVLAVRSQLYAAPAGTRLLERGMRDAWNLYLLEGSVTLTPVDGAMLRVDAGVGTAASAIAFLKPRKYTVETLTPVSFLWMHDALIEAVLSDATLAAGRRP
jgi:hypothetical protein